MNFYKLTTYDKEQVDCKLYFVILQPLYEYVSPQTIQEDVRLLHTHCGPCVYFSHDLYVQFVLCIIRYWEPMSRIRAYVYTIVTVTKKDTRHISYTIASTPPNILLNVH